jgi:hypothetical protein
VVGRQQDVQWLLGHPSRRHRRGGGQCERVAGRGEAVDDGHVELPGGHRDHRRVPAEDRQLQLGAERSVERYHCSYGLHPDFPARLEAHGLIFSGHDAAGAPRIAELPASTHPFFLATLFQPELAGDGTRPHPFVDGFARAATDHRNRLAADPTGDQP